MFKHHQFVEGITILLLAGYFVLAFLPDINIGRVLIFFLIQLGALAFMQKFEDVEVLEDWQKGGFLVVNLIWVLWGLVFIGAISNY